jgi:hypothetical protein
MILWPKSESNFNIFHTKKDNSDKAKIFIFKKYDKKNKKLKS